MTKDVIKSKLDMLYLYNFDRLYTTDTQDTYLIDLLPKNESVRNFNIRVSDFVSRLQSQFIIVNQHIYHDNMGKPVKAEIEFTWGCPHVS